MYYLYSESGAPNTQESETLREWYKLPDKLGDVATLTASLCHNSTNTRTFSRPCVCPTTDTKRDAAAPLHL